MTWFRRHFRARLLPLFFWCGCVAGATYLAVDLSQGGDVVGFAHSAEHVVAPMYAGRVSTISVELGQFVKAGGEVARLDTRPIEAEIRIEEARRQRIEDMIRATYSQARVQVSARTREFDQSTETTRLALEKTRANQQVKTAELNALTKQLSELRTLLKKQMVVKRDISALEVRHAALRNEVASAVAAERLLKSQLSAARARRQALPADSVQLSVAPFRAELKVVEGRLQQLHAQRAAAVLVAPTDGRVRAVHIREGGVARVGDAVVSLVSVVADRVVACVPEHKALTLRVDSKATVFPRAQAGQPLTGKVVAIGPVISEVPLRCRMNARTPMWGRDVVIRLDEPREIVSGLAFSVKFEPPGEQGSKAALAAALAAPELPHGPHLKLHIPDSLRSLSRFEPSGLTWFAGLNRFVVISDDTGQKNKNDHAPWLFTMDRHGRVDSDPLVIEGIDAVNDLESITRSADGSVYVLASQSYSKKDKRKRFSSDLCEASLYGQCLSSRSQSCAC